jgi:hypothetical protein
MPNGPLQPAARDEPGSQTQGSIEVAAERDGVCIATLRPAKSDIGVRSSKDGKSGTWRWACLHSRMVTSGRRGKMLKYYLSTLSTLSIFVKQTTVSDAPDQCRREQRCAEPLQVRIGRNSSRSHLMYVY